ncbi:sensor histidine kinase [Acidicapsa ligni]|uniref:sensor histidine kinase n=1 Tax=Acidicapsa ligni TaxID=542300 RepID=UPI0021E0E001|nr:HAMP domain-containing sensor histidine kinase [Acidicapsa ligni]
MPIAPILEHIPLTPGVDPSGGIDPQLLRQLLAVEKDKPKRTLNDLTESQSLAALARVAQFVAHDLRHHLCTVYANAEFMCSTNNNLSDRDELFEEIKAAIACMTDQLDALLLFSRTGCACHLHRQPLKEIVGRAVRMVRSHPDADTVSITVEAMPFIEGYVDSKWLCSAMFNLLLNACQAARFTPDMKEVGISLHQELSHIFIRVTDSGPGIPQSIQKILFRPFVNAERKDGMGLGLTIAECVAREHGGNVYLEETRPGRTTFVLRIPNPALEVFDPRCLAVGSII